MFRLIIKLPRIVALLTVLVFLPSLLNGAAEMRQGPANTAASLGSCPVQEEFVHFHELIRLETLLPLHPVRIARTQTSHSSSPPRNIAIFHQALMRLFAAVCLLYLIRRRWENIVPLLRKCIIRYIHDQDGRKGVPSVS